MVTVISSKFDVMTMCDASGNYAQKFISKLYSYIIYSSC
jgi:hypothetical protein